MKTLLAIVAALSLTTAGLAGCTPPERNGKRLGPTPHWRVDSAAPLSPSGELLARWGDPAEPGRGPTFIGG